MALYQKAKAGLSRIVGGTDNAIFLEFDPNFYRKNYLSDEISISDEEVFKKYYFEESWSHLSEQISRCALSEVSALG